MARPTLAALGFVLLAYGASLAAPGPLARCERSKLRTLGQAAKKLLTCDAKAARRGESADPACAQKALAVVPTRFARAEAKSPCPFTGEATVAAGLLDDLRQSVAGALLPSVQPSRCAHRKLGTAAKRAADVLRAQGTHAIGPEREKLGGLLEKAAGRFSKAWLKAEGNGDCLTLGDRDPVASLVDDRIAALVDVVRGTLQEVGGGRLVGAALRYDALGDPEYRATAARQLNHASTWGETVWTNVEPEQGVFDLAPLDQVVGFAEEHGMPLKGITLVWHDLLPTWMSALTDPGEFHDAMEHHITTLVATYAGRIAIWDVVNEGIIGGQLRNSVFLQRLGPDYIADAFRTAHAADPTALLFYNDFGIEVQNPSSDLLYQLVQDLLADGVPIHGVGFQMHIGITTLRLPDAAAIQANLQRFADLGLRVQLAEAEASLRGTNRRGALATQRAVYHDMVAACVAVTGCDMNFFGFTDRYFWEVNHEPLMFDGGYLPKAAFFGVRDALLGY